MAHVQKEDSGKIEEILKQAQEVNLFEKANYEGDLPNFFRKIGLVRCHVVK